MKTDAVRPAAWEVPRVAPAVSVAFGPLDSPARVHDSVHDIVSKLERAASNADSGEYLLACSLNFPWLNTCQLNSC